MNQSVIRLTRELSELQKSRDLSISVACRDIDVRNVRAVVLGPPDTPYEFGFFEFSLKFGRDYPGKAPTVTSLTTNSGRTRFNPNIYAGGKVCLSILGTWRGERGEEWSSAQGLESILISIQSLMSSNPYENEPGFENANAEHDKENMKMYCLKIRHETLRITVIARLEDYLGINPDGSLVQILSPAPSDDVNDAEHSVMEIEGSVTFEPFKDLCKRRFMWYYDSYLTSIAEERTKVTENQQFVRMPFEHSGNAMEGKFCYTELERRIKFVRERLDKETENWIAEGKVLVQKESGVAANLQRQYEQTVEHYKKSDSVTIDIELVDKNPFLWRVTYFGRPMTNLDGGLFNIELAFSPRFPVETPRAKFLTPFYHYRVTKEGIPCYTPVRADDGRSHIDAIIQLMEEENPPYDPRTQVNADASKLYWGTPEEKRQYNRKLRRSVQDSLECF
ncbi:ubiquitin-conjugating enzyme/RWD-like protein [Pyronema domesticum]|uniref:Similar to Ubiquitin-conjugating enzyme E2 Z acc. no. Q66KB0 n=1 Tax=Pyronema omphalodes (strain CBS 100304) TaxID=1076935 RepID=U4LYF1_PYROM|nr:ubiquitin-conjugating enzyme/RWD-like protein [Pyronema domesticum]CCX34868.1 Similar to Ubiquitin-conjugating enzyme E2 Z; acc. no. Q66KB0 [Pyronema omphalodes CBS 100304]